MKNRPNQYVLDRKSFCGKAAILCLFLAMVFRCVGGLLNLTIFEDRFATVEFLLPVGCCILYILCILIFGRRWFKISVVPFLLGVMACVLRLYSYDNLLQQEASFERNSMAKITHRTLSSIRIREGSTRIPSRKRG